MAVLDKNYFSAYFSSGQNSDALHVHCTNANVSSLLRTISIPDILSSGVTYRIYVPI